MRVVLAVLILVTAVALYAAKASASDNTSARPSFFGDGFDNTTCADLPRGQGCR